MRFRWDTATQAAWQLILFGGAFVMAGVALTIKGHEGAYAFVIIGVPIGLAGGVVLARKRRAMDPAPVTPRENLAANLLFVGLALILTMLEAVIDQGRPLWLLLVPFVFLGLGLYTLGRQRDHS